MLVAAHHVGQLGDRDRRAPPGGVLADRADTVELAGEGVDQLAVLGQQLALDATDLGVAEDVQPGAAQPLHAGQRLHRGHRLGAERDLLLHPHRAQDRRVQLDVRDGALAPIVGELVRELGVDGQAGDLVLILVGHQLVQVARYGQGELLGRGARGAAGAAGASGGAGARLALLGLRRAKGLDATHVVGGVGLVLVADQLVHPQCHDVAQFLGCAGAEAGEETLCGVGGDV